MSRKRQPKGRAASEQAGEPAAALAAAVTLLARRDFCSVELGAKLSAQGFEADAVRAALEDLIDRRYLDDERYARQFVVYRAERGQGPLRIRRDLAELGLQAALIETQLESHGEWVSLARQVLTRRFGRAPPRNWPDKARQMRFLQYRGFSNDDIRSALGPAGTDDLETDLDTDS
ncbi:MAG: regulatory protein RecX [Steroidobacteraceae bacterium]